jgi:hypothetical protein
VASSIWVWSIVLICSRWENASSKRDAAEDGAHRRARQVVHADEVVRVGEEGQAHVHDLAEDRRVDDDRDVVARDHLLAVAGAWRLADVDDLHDLDEGNDEGQAGVLDVLELTEAGDDADESLLDDSHGLHDARDDEPAR